MAEPLVDYAAYREYYTDRRFVPLPGPRRDANGRRRLGYRMKFEAPMGYFKGSLLTPAGRAVLGGLVEFARGRKPKFRGVRAGGVYFKWVVPAAPPDFAAVLAGPALDWLLDRGYGAVAEESTSATDGTPFVKITITY
jgi:hypothetical protein